MRSIIVRDVSQRKGSLNAPGIGGAAQLPATRQAHGFNGSSRDNRIPSLTIADELLERLKLWRQTTEFSADSDWIFASPLKTGRLPYSYTGVWRELDRASEAAGLGHMGTHTFRHSYRMWIDAIGTPIGVQQKLMRHSDIRTTMNIYGDAATADMREAHKKIVGLALHTV